MIQIFIPLGGISGWEDNELRYCLRSLETNLNNEYEVTVYSDHEVPWLQNVTFKVMNRYRAGADYENFWDTLNKIHEYALQLKEKKFVYLYDDCCLIRPCRNLNSIENIALELETPDLAPMRKDKHGKTVLASTSLMTDIIPFNYETHIPRIYSRMMLLELFEEFHILDLPIPPALATLYFNRYFPFPYTTLTKGQTFRASFTFEDDPDTGCYLASSMEEIRACSKGKMWLHYADKGLKFSPNGIPILKNYIQELFPKKSKFEI